MKIPKSFMLHGQTIEVEYDPMLCFRENANGLSMYEENKIVLQPCGDAHDKPTSRMEETFFHELVHHVLHRASGCDHDPPLRSDEGLVNRIAYLLHQAFVTAKY